MRPNVASVPGRHATTAIITGRRPLASNYPAPAVGGPGLVPKRTPRPACAAQAAIAARMSDTTRAVSITSPRQASPACSACPRAAIDPQNDAGDDACSCAQSTGAASLIASAPATRPMGTRASTSAAGPGRQMRPPAVFVPCGPGAMTSTVTPQGASSPAARRPVAQPQSHARALRSATALAACRAARVSRTTANRACVRNPDHDARASPSRGAP
jgi:hypothetical protein